MLSTPEDSMSMSSVLVNVGLNELLNVVSEGSCEKNPGKGWDRQFGAWLGARTHSRYGGNII